MGVDYVAYWLCCAAVRSHTSLTKVYTVQGILGVWLKMEHSCWHTAFWHTVQRVCVIESVNVCESKECLLVFVSVCWWMEEVEEVERGVEGGETPPGLTVLRVLHLANAAVGRGPLVVVLRQRQRANPRPWRWLGAGRLWLLQAAVIVAVLGRVLQVLRLIGRGEGHSAVGELWLADGERKISFSNI